MLAYTIGVTPLANARWFIASAEGAFAATAFRGDDLVLPGLVGEIPLGRVRDVAVDEFELRVNGVDSAGNWPADESAQFLSNLLEVQSLLKPADGQTIQVTRTLTTATGTTVQGPREARCVSDLAPRMEAPWTGLLLVRLKVYGGWV